MWSGRIDSSPPASKPNVVPKPTSAINASSGLLAWTTDTLGLQMAWLAKPLVEGGLAVLNFFLLRHVVYR